MAKVISKLAVVITATTKDLESGLKKSQTSMQRFSSGVLKFAAAATAGFISISAAVNQVSAAMQRLDATAKSARQLGLRVAELQGLQVIADRAGVSIQELQRGLVAMRRRISEASRGTGEAAKALETLGLNAEKLNTMGTLDQFATIVEEMDKLNNVADRIAFGDKIGSEVFRKIIPAMQGMSGAIRNAEQTAVNLGIAVDDIDAKAIEAANDAIADLKDQFSGLSNVIAVELAPHIQSLAEFLQELRGFYESVPDLFKPSKTIQGIAGVFGPREARVTLGEGAQQVMERNREREAAEAKRQREMALRAQQRNAQYLRQSESHLRKLQSQPQFNVNQVSIAGL